MRKRVALSMAGESDADHDIDSTHALFGGFSFVRPDPMASSNNAAVLHQP